MKRRLLNFLIFIHAVISRTAAIEPAAGLPKLGSIRRHAAALLTGVSLIGVSSPLFSSPVPALAISQSETQLINIFERNTPSCVYINTFYNQLNAFSTDVSQIPAGTGTGFVWRDSKTEQFFVVTNYHVVRNSAGARITFLGKGDGKPVVVDAGIRGVDPDKDICVLSLEKAPTELLARLEPVRLGTSSTLRVGQQALAIGNPFGLDHTLTTGIISGLGRMVTSPSGRPISNVIQTDAAINPGNSGGPLLDSDGNLIGMNTAIYSTTGSSSGIGFAIPVDTVRYEVETLIREGRVERPIIGITYLESSRAQDVGIGTGVLVLGYTIPFAIYYLPSDTQLNKATNLNLFSSLLFSSLLFSSPLHFFTQTGIGCATWQ
jgi:S1-C subfamily serine protease